MVPDCPVAAAGRASVVLVSELAWVVLVMGLGVHRVPVLVQEAVMVRD